MTTHHITGRTWSHRHILREWNGDWDNTRKRWTFDNLSSDQLEQLSRMVGVMVTDVTPVTPSMQIFGDDPTYVNYFVDKNPSAFFGFSSLAVMCDYVEALPIPPNNGRTCDIGWSTNSTRQYVTATKDMPEALALARNGWIDGMGLHKALLTPRPLTKRRTHGLSGGSVNVGRMLAGNPAHMRKRHKAPGQKRITLFVQSVMWIKIKPDMAINRALVIAAMIDLLEQEGYICDIVAVFCTAHNSWGGQGKSQITVKIKDAGQRLNLLDIMFALGHPAFSRRMCFACEGAVPECKMSYDDRGIIRPAFDTDNPCGRGEFYVPFLEPIAVSRITADPMSMLKYIEPEGLPISLKERM